MKTLEQSAHPVFLYEQLRTLPLSEVIDSTCGADSSKEDLSALAEYVGSGIINLCREVKPDRRKRPKRLPRLEVVSSDELKAAINLVPLEESEWKSEARCFGLPVDMFYGDDEEEEGAAFDPREAQRVCKNCPVKVECLAAGLSNSSEAGVWGGTTVSARRTIRTYFDIKLERKKKIKT